MTDNPVKTIFQYAERLCRYDYLQYSEVMPALKAATPDLERMLKPQDLNDFSCTLGLLACAEELGHKPRDEESLELEREGIRKVRLILKKCKRFYK